MNKFHLIATAAGGVALGIGIGYKIAEKRLMVEFEERLERETNSVRKFYQVVTDKPDLDEIAAEERADELHAEALQAMLAYEGEKKEPVSYHTIRKSGIKPGEPPEEKQPANQNIFQERDERGEIFVITGDEYEEGELEYIQTTLTYYAEDGVVTDIHEDRIEDYSGILGDNFAQEFGKHNDDENVVHVRNNVLCIDYEVVRHSSSYRKAVLDDHEGEPELPSGRDRAQRPSDRMTRGG